MCKFLCLGLWPKKLKACHRPSMKKPGFAWGTQHSLRFLVYNIARTKKMWKFCQNHFFFQTFFPLMTKTGKAGVDSRRWGKVPMFSLKFFEKAKEVGKKRGNRQKHSSIFVFLKHSQDKQSGKKGKAFQFEETLQATWKTWTLIPETFFLLSSRTTMMIFFWSFKVTFLKCAKMTNMSFSLSPSVFAGNATSNTTFLFSHWN